MTAIGTDRDASGAGFDHHAVDDAGRGGKQVDHAHGIRMAVRRGRAAHVHHQRQRAVRRHDEVEGHEPGGQVFGRVVRDAWDGAAFIDVQHAQAVRVGLDDKSAAAVGRKRDGDDRRTDVDLAAGLHPAVGDL
ncbi:hypothetical protein G6F65_020201 [Rhizopus arrhizus]|nr:hypothetical protein G6F65_020201 [Rhizopus arrhizus]